MKTGRKNKESTEEGRVCITTPVVPAVTIWRVLVRERGRRKKSETSLCRCTDTSSDSKSCDGVRVLVQLG